MDKAVFVGRGRYVEFVRLVMSITVLNRFIKLTILSIVVLSLVMLFLLPSLTPLLLLTAASLVVSMVLHEFTHFVILNTDVVVVFENGLVRIEAETDGVRAMASALMGPLAPFFIGVAIWHYHPLPAAPFIAHIATLPFDILGALGVKICEKQC
ncbi:MAG: hypothetical protein ACK4M3_05530 [Pyrobaculum sp.]